MLNVSVVDYLCWVCMLIFCVKVLNGEANERISYGGGFRECEGGALMKVCVLLRIYLVLCVGFRCVYGEGYVFGKGCYDFIFAVVWKS